MNKATKSNEVYELNLNELGPSADSDTLSAREEFLRDQNTCCLCGDSLTFSHSHESELKIIKEVGRCPSCHIQLRSRSFRVH